MTPQRDLVASAIALCEERDRKLRARLKDETIEAFIRDLKIQIAQNSTHLAEFGEHKAIKDYDISGASDFMCGSCCSPYPCRDSVTKAKRLLGKIE